MKANRDKLFLAMARACLNSRNSRKNRNATPHSKQRDYR